MDIPDNELERICDHLQQMLDKPNNPAAQSLGRIAIETLNGYNPRLLREERNKFLGEIAEKTGTVLLLTHDDSDYKLTCRIGIYEVNFESERLGKADPNWQCVVHQGASLLPYDPLSSASAIPMNCTDADRIIRWINDRINIVREYEKEHSPHQKAIE